MSAPASTAAGEAEPRGVLGRIVRWIGATTVRAATKVGDWMVREETRLFELRPQYVKSVSHYDIQNHVIVVNNAGMPVPVKKVGEVPWTTRNRAGRFLRRFSRHMVSHEDEKKAYKERLKKMMAKIKKEGKTVAIIVHGGMENPYKALKDSDGILDEIHTQYYPIFVIWDSYLSAYPEQLLLVRSGHYSPFGLITGPLFFFLGDLLSCVGVVLSLIPAQVRSWWVGRPNYPNPDPAVALIERLAASVKNGSPNIHVAPLSYTQEESPFIDRLGWALIWPRQRVVRLLTYFILGVMAPRTWQNLRRRARAMFRAPEEFDALVAGKAAVCDGVKPHEAKGAVAQLAERLVETIGVKSDTPMPVTLIAHSLGSMITNEFINHAGKRLSYANIVYMAPACSVRDFADAVVPALRRNTGARAYVLTLHPKAEVNEQSGRGFLPRGSVLEWLERFLDPPLAHLDRTLGKFDNVWRALHVFPEEVRAQIHIKPFPFDGVTKPFEHVHFNDPDLTPRYWDPKFWW